MTTAENPGSQSPKAAKRPRLESPSSIAQGERDPEFYFKDGSIVLSAYETARDEGTQLFFFRVHLTLLAKTSKVFADMLDLPVPDPVKEDQDSYDGVPLVHLQDDAKNIRGFLSVIYKTQLTPKDRYSDNTVKSLLGPLIISKKYEATDLREHIISFIHENWPQDYEEWKVALKVIDKADSGVYNPETTIQLSWDADIRDEITEPLAFAYHHLSCYNLATFDPTLLNSTDILIAMQGHQSMRTWFHNSVINWSPKPCNTQKCDIARLKDALLLSSLKSGQSDLLVWWELQAASMTLVGLCSSRCRSKTSTWLKGLVTEAYHKIPEFFSLLNWKVDGDEESTSSPGTGP